MNNDILKGKWKELRGEIRKRWGRITEQELEEIGGNLDSLKGKIQAAYGYTKDELSREIDELLKSPRPVSK